MKTTWICSILISLGLLSSGSAQEIVPNDPGFTRQYGLHYTETPLAWNFATGSMKIVVAVIDTGVDYTHPDLYLNTWINQKEIPPRIRHRLVDLDGDGLITFWDLNDPVNQGSGKIADLNNNGYVDGGDLLFSIEAGGWADGRDNGKNGFIDDLIGWDFRDNDNDPMDFDGHGTFCSGIIGATANNNFGIAGVNWRVSVMAVRRPPNALTSIRYAVDNGAHISNNSYGFDGAVVPPELVAATTELLKYAAERDHLFVTAAGNNKMDIDVPPSFLPAGLDSSNILSVAATDRADRLAYFSNYGAQSVDLGAPGHAIWSTVPDSYLELELSLEFGTSFAGPYVAGAAALMLSVNPTLTVEEIRDRIMDNVDPVKDLSGITVTGGRLNTFRAVSAALWQ